MLLHHKTGVSAFSTLSLTQRGSPAPDQARQRLDRDFERLALIPRLIILAVLGIGALLEYGHGYRSAHWVGLLVYGLTTTVLALWPERRRPSWLPWAATAVDAVLTVYVIAEHLPRGAADLDRATDAVSLMPAFLLLMQTGLRLRRDLVALYAGLTLVGWAASIPVLIPPEELTAVALRQTHSILSFAAAAGFVLYAVHGMQVAWSATLKAELDRLLLSRFLPRGVASDVVRTGGETDAVNRHACLLILDLRGFSALTRERPSGEVVADLMKFRALVHDAVSASGGVVDKYMGDGVLALFLEGTPEEQASAALQAVTDIFREFEIWNRSRAAAGRPALRTIAALHRGMVLTGVFDDGRRAEFTVLGPAMNALARIERRAKEADADVLASKGFVRMLAEPARSELQARRLPRRKGEDELPDVCSISIAGGGPSQHRPVAPPWAAATSAAVTLAAPVFIGLQLAPVAYAQTVQIVGLGASSCAEFAEEIRREDGKEREYFAWAQGFMSGVAARAPTGVDEGIELTSRNMPLLEQAEYVRHYRARAPEQQYPDAVLALYRELRRRSDP